MNLKENKIAKNLKTEGEKKNAAKVFSSFKGQMRFQTSLGRMSLIN